MLLVDADPQECLTAALGVASPEPGQSLAEVLLGQLADLESVMVRVFVPSTSASLVPAGVDLAEAEARLVSDPGAVLALREAIKQLAVTQHFDFVLIDCPPSLGLLTTAALTAADDLLIPAQTEYLALRRVGAILRTVEKVRSRLNPGLRILGVLPTMYDGRTLHAREVLEELRKAPALDGVRVFKPVPRSVRFADASTGGMSIFERTGAGRRAVVGGYEKLHGARKHPHQGKGLMPNDRPSENGLRTAETSCSMSCGGASVRRNPARLGPSAPR